MNGMMAMASPYWAFQPVRNQSTLKNLSRALTTPISAPPAMKPEAIMEMDWLVANVKGSIPTMDTLIDAAQTVVQLKGVEETK